MKPRSATLLALLVLFAAVGVVHGRTRYDQPYLGSWPERSSRFSAKSLRTRREEGLEGLVTAADTILVGSAHNLHALKAHGRLGRIQSYEADVKVLRVIKGDPKTPGFHLTFAPSATGIEDGAEHVFFLDTRKGQRPISLGAWYMHPPKLNSIRVVGCYDCSKDVAMDLLAYLVTGKHEPALRKRLLAEFRSESWGKMYSAVVMAAATAPEIGKDVLRETVTAQRGKRFDFNLFCRAAESIAAKQGEEGLRVLLKNIQTPGEGSRVEESVVFDLLATYGSEKIVPDLAALVEKKPHFAVSAAYALAKIGGAECRKAIEGFLADEDLVRRTEKISNGWTTSELKVSKLLQKALAECGDIPR